jgi:type I restriction enzyme S subunit
MSESVKSIQSSRIPEGWIVVTIGKVATVVRGASPRPKGDPRYYGGNVPRLMGEDVTRDGKYTRPRIDFLTEEGAKKSRFMKKGTLTMICSGNVGVPSFLAVDACIHDGFLAFPEVSDECSVDFLYYIFDSLRSKFYSSATHGGVFTNLTTSIIKDFEIALPPLPEQQKIAEILSTVDEKIEVIDEQIKQTQELKKGLMQRLLTKGIGHTKFKDSPLGEIPESWEVVPIYNLRNKGDKYSFTGGPFGSDLKSEHYTDSGVRVIQLQDIGEGHFIDKSRIYVSEEKADDLKSCNIYPNDIILAKMAPVARCCKVPHTEDRFVMCSDGIRLSVDRNKFDNEFIFQALNSKYFRDAAEAKSTGTTRARIGLSDLKAIPLAVPNNIQEQQKIAEILLIIDKKVEVLQNKKHQYKILKKGLMQQLLTGKIRVKLAETADVY